MKKQALSLQINYEFITTRCLSLSTVFTALLQDKHCMRQGSQPSLHGLQWRVLNGFITMHEFLTFILQSWPVTLTPYFDYNYLDVHVLYLDMSLKALRQGIQATLVIFRIKPWLHLQPDLETLTLKVTGMPMISHFLHLSPFIPDDRPKMHSTDWWLLQSLNRSKRGVGGVSWDLPQILHLKWTSLGRVQSLASATTLLLTPSGLPKA